MNPIISAFSKTSFLIEGRVKTSVLKPVLLKVNLNREWSTPLLKKRRGWGWFHLIPFLLLLYSASLAQSIPGEQRLSLNGPWAFKTDPDNQGETGQWFAGNYPTAGWESMTVPGNWDTHNAYARYDGKAWYRKQVDVPADWAGKSLRLHFEAVYHDAKVWLNGELLGESRSGFFPFAFDVSDKLKPGQQNTITLVADNTFRRGAIWNWGGIRRPVSLVAYNPVHIEQTHVLATPDLSRGTARIAVNVWLRNDSDQPRTVSCELDITSPATGKSKRLAQSLSLPARSAREYTLETRLDKSQVRLWHFDDPQLYQLQVRITQGNTVHHQQTERFGIRKLEVDGLKVKLNGEEVRLLGYNWVPDDRTTGNTLPAWRYREDIDLMKRAGANMARLSHLPLPKEVLDYLDEKGMLVFSEIPLWGEDALVDPDNPLPKEWLKSLVNGQFNHPSVIGWCVGNEIGYLNANPRVMEYVESAIRYVKTELDQSRLVVYVTHSADTQEKDPVQFSDMILLNKYASLGSSADKVHRLHPGKPVFYAEYGYNLTDEDPDKGTIDAPHMLNDIRDREYLMGAALWTFNDYRSHWQAHAAWNTAPTENRSWGIVNVFRQPKRAYEAFRRESAPVKSMTLRHSDDLRAGQTLTTTVAIQPRGIRDLPAYVLRNYTLVWEVKDAAGRHQQGGFFNLPEIKPGAKAVNQPIRWTVPEQNAGWITCTLLSPTGYAVYDTTVYLQKPSAPEIRAVIPGESGVRIVFGKTPGAEQYVVSYGQTDFSGRSDTTINHYVDIPKLEAGKSYRFRVAGLNGLGEGTPSETVSATPAAKLLPPVIRAVEPADSSFFIGHGYRNYDYLYEIRYGTQPDNPEQWKSLKVTTRGLTRIPHLTNGQTYYVQMRRTVQQYVESEWSEVYAVRPNGQQPPEMPAVSGVLRNGNAAIIAFRPVPQASGYVLRYGEGTQEKTLTFNGSHLQYLRVNGLEAGKDYAFRLSALNASGESEPSPAVQSNVKLVSNE
jgi:beta-galactosidase